MMVSAGWYKSIVGFSKRIVIAITDTADRRFEACFCQTLCIRRILRYWLP